MTETVICPHCQLPYEHRAPRHQSDEEMVRCPNCQGEFQLLYGRDTDLAAQARVGLYTSQFRCPYCFSTEPPFTTSKIAPAGWVVFAVLLFLFFPLCWIGLLIQEKTALCNSCRNQLV